MFQRLEHPIQAVRFPQDWSEKLKQILLKIYGDKCISDNNTFEVYGFSYPTEVLMIISYLGLDKFKTPLSLFLSCDLKKETKTDEIINDMFDAAGVFFDTYFQKVNNSNEPWEDYVLDWEETNFSKLNFFYKVTRENIALSIEADQLLSD